MSSYALSATYAWRQTGPNVWQRGADEMEAFWATAARLFNSSGRMLYEVTGHVSLQVEISRLPPESPYQGLCSALRKAWCKVRYEHPTIASRIQYNHENEAFQKVYRGLESGEQLEEWLTQTFVEVSGYRSGLEFVNSDPPSPALPTLFVVNRDATDQDGIQSHARVDLVFRAAHDTIDGMGTLLLFGNLIRHASAALELDHDYPHTALDGAEVANLSPPYRMAAAVSQVPAPHLQERIDSMYKHHVFQGRPPPGIAASQILCLPYRPGAEIAGKPRRSEILFNPPVAEMIMAACKKMEITVTHLFHAAIPLVMRDMHQRQPEAQRFTYVNDILYNLRPKCINPYSSAQHPVTAYSSGSATGFCVDVTVPEQDHIEESVEEKHVEFMRVLDIIKDFYENTRDDSDLGQLAPHMFAGLLTTMPKPVADPIPGPPPDPRPSVSLSSLGRVDSIIPQRVGHIEILNPWVTGDQMGNSYGLFLVTHRNHMNLGATWNEAWHNETDVAEFLTRYRDLVLEIVKWQMDATL